MVFTINFHKQNNTESPSSQLELIDKTANGKVNDWSGKKQRGKLLAFLMKDIDTIKPSVKQRVNKCGDFLWFNEYIDGSKKLYSAWLCKYRLCPVCVWRRSLKTFVNTARILDYVKKEKYKYVFLTLTIKNCSPEDLQQSISDMLHGWDKFKKRRELNRLIKGYYRGIEVTRNTDFHSKSYGTFHPHIHVLLVLPSSYGSRNYIKQSQFKQYWKESMQLDYDPVVDIRAIKPNKQGDIIPAICEATKYPVKDSEYIIPDDLQFSKETIAYLHDAFKGRRLYQYGGVLAKAQRELKIASIDSDEDLITLAGDDDKSNPQILCSSCYAFNTGVTVGTGKYLMYRQIPFNSNRDEHQNEMNLVMADFHDEKRKNQE